MEEDRRGKNSPLWARLSVNHTKKTCCLSLLIPIVAIGIIAGLNLFKLNSPSQNEYTVKDSERSNFHYGRLIAIEENPFESGPAIPQVDQNGFRSLTVLMQNTAPGGGAQEYDENAPRNNMLTREVLSIMKSAEDEVTNSADYSKFCWKDVDNDLDCTGKPRPCALPSSLTNHPLLYGEYSNGTRLCGRKPTSEPVSEAQFSDFMKAITLNDTGVDPSWSGFLANDFNRSSTKTQALRSYINVGDPFANITGMTTDEEKESSYRKWSKDLAASVEGKNDDKYHTFLFSLDRSTASFDGIIFRDLSFAGGSILLVYIIVCLHTRSFFLATTTLAQILLSFPLTYLFYRGVVQIKYFAALQIMTIFLILGIGADDVFVFTDAWKQGRVLLGPNASLVDRMAFAYRRAVKAMAVTSFTTSVAFFSTAFSPIMPISTLGVWAGLLILLQFFLVITVYPCALIIEDRFWSNHRWYRCFRNKKPVDEPEVDPEAPRTLRQRLFSRKEGELRLIEKFFNKPWTNFTYTIRFPLLLVGAGLMGVSIWLATRLETPVETEQFLPEDDPLRKASRVLNDRFPAINDNQNIVVRAMWGVSGVDRSKADKYDPEDFGSVVYDTEFSMKSANAQQRILQACSYFADSSLDLLSTSPTIPDKVKCWPSAYFIWRNSSGRPGFQTFDTDAALVSDLTRFANATIDGKQPFRKFFTDKQILFNEDRSRVVYTEVSFVSKILAQSPASIVDPDYENWQNALENFNAGTTAEGVKRAAISGGIVWVFAVTQTALVNNMYLGIGIVLAVSLLALTISTGNVIVSFLALVSIAGILTNVLALVYLFGWKLGITESIGVVIAIGFSFDYVAHVANAYVESSRSISRKERTRTALTELGISVLAGAVSTILAGSMLFFAIIIFFVKFGVFVVTTVSLALIWGLLFFPALLFIAGPTGNIGEVYVFAKRLLPCFGRKQSGAPKDVEEDSSETIDVIVQPDEETRPPSTSETSHEIPTSRSTEDSPPVAEVRTSPSATKRDTSRGLTNYPELPTYSPTTERQLEGNTAETSEDINAPPTEEQGT